MDCLFCKIVAGDIPSFRVYEDDYAFAFLDINPITNGHTLVVPKIHVQKISDMENSVLNGTMEALQRVVHAVETAVSQDLNIFVNQGEVAGQVMPHFHIHVVPRTTGDAVKFVTPTVKINQKEFENISRKIKAVIKV